MKKLYFFAMLACFGLSNNIDAQAPNFNWAKQMGSIGHDAGNSIAVDANGNVYTTGYFEGTADFDPGPDTYNLTSAGYSDIFVSKLNASGNFLWAKQFGGPYDQLANTEFGSSIAVDASGNVYTTGQFYATADFDPGSGIYNLGSLTPSSGTYVSKLDASGNFVWAKQLGDGSLNASGYSIAVDASFNVYSTGHFDETGDFDPGPATYNLTSPSLNIFVSKLDNSGNFVWAKQLGGGSLNASGYSIALDASGNVYTTGEFDDTGDFDPGPGTYNLTSAGDYVNAFVSKLDASGNFLWAKQFRGAEYPNAGQGIAVEPNGNVYTTGYFDPTVDFDPGPATYNLTGGGTFVSKLDASGNFLWAREFTGVQATSGGFSIALDANANAYTTGGFHGQTDFNPGAGTNYLSGGGIFVSKLSANGYFGWAIKLGNPGNDSGNSIDLDANGNVYLTGDFDGTGDFNPHIVEDYYLTSAGDYDIFVAKLGTVTGIDESAVSINDLTIYPNPNTGRFTVSLKSDEVKSIEILCINTLGQSIFSKEYNLDNGELKTELDLSAVGKGLYLIQIRSNGKSVFHKVTIIE